jgi:hypothetical protein
MSMIARNKSRRIGVGVALLSLALAGCGGSSSPKAAPVQPKPSGAQVVLDAVQLTAAAKTARIAISASSSSSSSSSFSASVTGVADFSTGNSQLTFAASGAAGSVLGGGLVMRSVAGVVYMQLPPSLEGVMGLPAGAEWMSIPLPKFGAQSPIGGAGQTDPTQMLASLEAVSSNVTTVGTATIRGVATTHYHALLDLGKAIDTAKVPASLRSTLQQMLGKLGGMSSIPVDVWVDGAGRMRRLSETTTLPSAGAFTTTMDLYDFGVPVNVQAPPADQVAQLPSLGSLGGLGGASGPTGSAA